MGQPAMIHSAQWPSLSRYHLLEHRAMGAPSNSTNLTPAPKIWWSNSLFFLFIHIAAVLGIYYRPPTVTPWPNLLLFFLVWQLSDFGWVNTLSVKTLMFMLVRITIGYHRLYSHRAFRAGLPVRILLAALGSAGFQGSIKVSTVCSGAALCSVLITIYS